MVELSPEDQAIWAKVRTRVFDSVKEAYDRPKPMEAFS
jgi:hypothetical protein